MTDSLDAAMDRVPHAFALGMAMVERDGNVCRVRLPYDAHLVGDPDSGVLHGGAITAMLDQAAGIIARPAELPEDAAVGLATLSLRIDYMAAATPGRDVLARARCVKRTRNVAFVQAVAYHDDPADPIATCTATFMLGTPNAPRPSTMKAP